MPRAFACVRSVISFPAFTHRARGPASFAVAALVVSCTACGVEPSIEPTRTVEESPSPRYATALAADVEEVNGCDRSSAVDRRGEPVVEVHFGGELGHAYRERCLRVSVGTLVRFVGPLSIHPIAPGHLVDGLSQLTADGAFRAVAEGDSAEFRMPDLPAVEGYFCNYHVDEGMLGAVFVEAGEVDENS